MRWALTLVAVVLCLSGVTAVGASAPPVPANGTAPGNDTADASITAVYPNPVAEGDAGEFVRLSVPPETELGRLSLADHDSTAALPNVTANGTVTLSTAPNRTAELVERPVYALDGVALANTGEAVTLSRDGTVLDRLQYRDAPEGEVFSNTAGHDGPGWRPLGATDHHVVTAGPGTVQTFVLPDAPDVALDHLRGADRRILLGAYTLTSQRVTDALVAAARRNVSVRVLVDGDPVGGLTRQQATRLDRLVRAGATVRALGGDRTRYEFHHAKYAIVDDSALVTTENWKAAGVGGASSRGWGVITDQQRVVAELADVFRGDFGWRGAVAWQEFRAEQTYPATNASTGEYPGRFDPQTVRVNRTRVLVAPDNAETAVVGLIDNATESLAIEQVSIGSRDQPFLRAAIDAARRGVEVRILLSSAWYVEEENRQLVSWLDDRADAEGLPLTARLAEPRGRFEKIHAKGLVIDGDQVVLGSLNWNNHSARENREVVVVLEGREAGAYFQRTFEADWPTTPPVPVGVILVAAGTALVAVAVGSRLTFAGPDDVSGKLCVSD